MASAISPVLLAIPMDRSLASVALSEARERGML
jgi:hypothetical protein